MICLSENSSWTSVFGAWAQFFCNFDSNLLVGLSKLHSTGHGNFFMKNRLFKKHSLSKFFSVSKIDYQSFFRNLSMFKPNFFLAGLSELHSLCPEKQSTRKKFLKNIVFLHLRKLGESLPQVFPTTCLSDLLSTCQWKNIMKETSFGKNY